MEHTKNSNRYSTRQIAFIGVMAAIVFVSNYIQIKIPVGINDVTRIHVANAFCLLAGIALGPVPGGLAAGIGSALADVFSGYVLYAPATFAIKGAMALIVYFGYKLLSKKLPKRVSQLISCIVAEVVMVLGYFVFEGFLYGFGPSLVNIPANAVQGLAGLILGIILMNVFEKTKIKF